MVAVFNSEDKTRIMEQLVELWKVRGEGMNLVGIRFDQSPVDWDSEEYPSIAIIWTEDNDPDMYFIGWGEVSRSEDGIFRFTEDDLESWSESGQEPWYGDVEEYSKLVSTVYPEHPEWEHVYLYE